MGKGGVLNNDKQVDRHSNKSNENGDIQGERHPNHDNEIRSEEVVSSNVIAKGKNIVVKNRVMRNNKGQMVVAEGSLVITYRRFVVLKEATNFTA